MDVSISVIYFRIISMAIAGEKAYATPECR